MAQVKAEPSQSLWAIIFKVMLSLVVILGLVGMVVARPEVVLRPRPGQAIDLLWWIVAVAAVELLPVPLTNLRFSLDFPILLGVAILYPSPLVVGMVALVGAFDPREVTREIDPLTAVFNRCQLAVSFFVAGVVFRSLATAQSSLPLLVPAVLLATAAVYTTNAAILIPYLHVRYGTSLRSAANSLRVGGATEFFLSYLGLGFAAVIIARLYLAVHFWAVAVFILPLVFARQMFFRTLALEEAGKKLKDREQVLRALSNRMAEERQDERMQIAGYLHDDLAQMLFRLTLQAEMAKKRLAIGDTTAVSKDLDGILSTKEETSDAIRALIRDLHRSPMGRKGLADAIQSFAEDISRGLATTISAEIVEVALPPPIQLLIYQIAREAAMNALKHAEADTIRISLQEVESGVELQIRDDGKGFDTSAPPPEGHFGSVMMRERALVAGGKYSIASEPGQGTTISAQFPRVWVEEGTALEAASGTSPESGEGATQPPDDPPAQTAAGSPTAEPHLQQPRDEPAPHEREHPAARAIPA
jgi:signal transduction histidine kinase